MPELHGQVRTVRVEKRSNDIVNRLNKTKVERTPDLKGDININFAFVAVPLLSRLVSLTYR